MINSPSDPEFILDLQGISKSFGRQKILSSLTLQVFPGEFLTLLGPSGCGKTTTLRIIGGFEKPDSGQVFLLGKNVTHHPPYSRNVHTVFQHYALFPHYDVFENVAFSLRLKGLSEMALRNRVLEALALVRLSGLEHRRPDQLSGGQQQRVALARALAGQPSVLLLDEPLGALDLKLRKEMQLELKRLQRQLQITFIYVTHDQEEALTLSDRIAVFHGGRVEQMGTPREIYETPQSSFVADFIGSSNILSARVQKLSENGNLGILLENETEVILPAEIRKKRRFAEGNLLTLGIRPEHIRVLPANPVSPAPGRVRLPCRLRETIYLGSITQCFLSPFKESPKVLVAASPATGNAHDARTRPLDNSEVWAEFSTEDILILS